MINDEQLDSIFLSGHTTIISVEGNFARHEIHIHELRAVLNNVSKDCLHMTM